MTAPLFRKTPEAFRMSKLVFPKTVKPPLSEELSDALKELRLR